MLAVKFKDKEVVLEDVARPAGEGVLVNVRSCGICGSDVTILDSGFPINGTPGHEIAGELEVIGWVGEDHIYRTIRQRLHLLNTIAD